MWKRHPSLSELRSSDPSFKDRVDNVYRNLQSQKPADMLISVSRPRELHHLLFQPLMLGGYPAGEYRGTVGTPYEHLNIEVFNEKTGELETMMSDFKYVERDMKAWSKQVRQIDLTQTASKFFKRLVYLYFRLLNIHPFFDGNGHVSRLFLLSMLSIRGDIHIGNESIHPTPFDRSLTYVIDGYRIYPTALEGYLSYKLSIRIDT